MTHPELKKRISNALDHFPRVKRMSRRWFQEVRDLACQPAERGRFHPRARLLELPLSPGRSSFFGYYTRSPWNVRGDILFQETRGRQERASLHHRLTLKVYRPSSGEVATIGQTNAWNWQQGCMLQWLGRAGENVIHNAYSAEDDAYHSRVLDPATGTATRICQPIYSVSPQATYALTLNFSRLARLRPDYGYFNKRSREQLDFAEDGIWRIDLVKNESRLILSLKEIMEFAHSRDMENAAHKVNHIDISPDGKRFLFLHRWFTRSGKVTRLLTADADGGSLYCLANEGMVSHCTWKNEKQILAWTRKAAVGDRYFLFTDRSEDYQVVGEGRLVEDGHPSFSPSGRWLLTDTYPDEGRMSSLLLFDMQSERRIELGALFQPFKFSDELRCDLHPRWSLDGNFVSFDSCHTGRRRFYVLDVSGVVEALGE